MNRYQTDSLFETEDVQQSKCSHIIRVAFETAADMEFDYLVPDEFWPIEAGQRVEVPFGRKNKLEKGFCVEIDFSHREPFDLAQGRHRERREAPAGSLRPKLLSKRVSAKASSSDNRPSLMAL